MEQEKTQLMTDNYDLTTKRDEIQYALESLT